MKVQPHAFLTSALDEGEFNFKLWPP